MTKEELTYHTRQIVKYLLPKDCREDIDTVDSYTSTLVMLAEEYAEGGSKN